MEATNIILREVDNQTNTNLDVCQSRLRPINIPPGQPTRIGPEEIRLRICARAEDYREHFNEDANPFFYIKTPYIVGPWVARIFDQHPEGRGEVVVVFRDRNSYDQRVPISIQRRNDERPRGLYLKFGLTDATQEPDPTNIWIVGELVTDVAGDDLD